MKKKKLVDETQKILAEKLKEIENEDLIKAREGEPLFELILGETDQGELSCELDFIESALDIVFEATSSAHFEFDGANWHPIVWEALKKVRSIGKLIDGMKLVSQPT
jgi:hypothetical protein